MAQFNIAIVGGGLCGSALARSLLNYPNFNFNVYEAGRDFGREQGAVLSISKNGLLSLEGIGIDVGELLVKTGAVPFDDSDSVMGHGPAAGKDRISLRELGERVNIHRAKLVDAILEGIPKHHLHTCKKLVSVDYSVENSPAKLWFEDGSVAAADIVFGADGIHSSVRESLLGKDHPAVKPVYVGFWWAYNILPTDEAQNIMHPLDLNIAQATIYGDGGFLMNMVINNGTHCVPYAVGMAESWDTKSWEKIVSKDYIRSYFTGWDENSQAIVRGLLEQPQVICISEWESAKAPTYYKYPLCIVGDAAHAPCPWGTAGANIALEDVLILNALFNHVKTKSDLSQALHAYDIVRRPQTQEVVQASRLNGMLFCGKVPEFGLDAKKLEPVIADQFRFIRGLDAPAHVEEAINTFNKVKELAKSL